MAICWEICREICPAYSVYFMPSELFVFLSCLVSGAIWCQGQDVEFIVSVPDHCLSSICT